MTNNDQVQSQQIQIQGKAFTRLSNDSQVKKIVADTQKLFDFYQTQISDVKNRLDNVRADILKKDIQA